VRQAHYAPTDEGARLRTILSARSTSRHE
jgi:hypothetical protein